MEGSVPIGSRSIGARKRTLVKTKRKLDKEMRYANKDPDLMEFVVPCNHKEGKFKCGSIPAYFLVKSKKFVLAVPDKLEQDQRLSRLITAKSPKCRKMGRSYKAKCKRNDIVVNYEIQVGEQRHPVCAKFFQKLFGIGQTRLNNIAKRLKKGEAFQDKRGGNRKKEFFCVKRKKVKEFISSLKARESHYSRNKSRRLYLPAELNINKLFVMYNASAPLHLKVKKWFFHNIFFSEFNIGFGTPASDMCSYCARMKFQIQSEKDLKLKSQKIAELGAHKFRAKQFHELMKFHPVGAVTFCFDLQQIQPLPKLSIGEAYYSRQISFYALCVTDIGIKHPEFYTWIETQAGRGANEVASAVTSFLEGYAFDKTVSTVRLFADGCGGQNKNTHVVHALAYWLLNKAPPQISAVNLIFPVRGHSFLPADRVFGLVERVLRRQSDIVTPEKYREFYKEVGTVKILGESWVVRDYKQLSSVFKKVSGIKEMKRILIKRVKKSGNSCCQVMLKMEPTFRCDDPSKVFSTLAKRGAKFNNLIPPVISNPKPLTDVKKTDIQKLLTTRFGVNWKEVEELQFFVSALNIPPDPDQDQEIFNNEENEDCDCLHEEAGLEKL